MTPSETPSAPHPPIGELLSRLDGLEHRPLGAQVEVLDAVRRGLDEALTPAPDAR